MLVSDVEILTGLSKKSIRYYEEMGLIKPNRNKENDYRLYNEDDIKKLKVIKFLRELDVPIREIKLLNENKLTLRECIKERIKKIEKEEENYQKIKNMCIEISESNDTFSKINIEKYFREIKVLNKEGFTMRNTKTNRGKKIKGACLSSLIFTAFFIFILSLISYFQFTEVEKIPWALYVFLVLIFIFPIISIFYNLVIRIKEIKGGEEDEASKY